MGDERDEEIKRLREKVANQAHQLKWQQESLAQKNRALDAMHWVWCDGGCRLGAGRYDSEGRYKGVGVDSITEEAIAIVERNLARMKRTRATRLARLAREKGPTT